MIRRDLLLCTVWLLAVIGSAAESDSAEAEVSVARVADRLVEDFRGRHNIPGVSIAIAREGRLVFAKGYGHADSAGRVPVTPEQLFRIASVSKPITSIAVMRLVEKGRLTLQQTVFGPGSILGTRYGTKPYRGAVESITVEHLLTHTAGGWGNRTNDPMFRRFELGHADLIGWVLDSYQLHDAPGGTYAYSNFGYCVLGRVIEAVHGKPYEQAVRELVLQPAGVRDMRVGASDREGRHANDVDYLQGNDFPYRMGVTRMDAHGGWIASATDLLRLAVRVNGFGTVPDLLQPETIRVMTTPSRANPGYAKGWAVNAANNWWHMGSMPGTGAVLVRAQNGFCWAVLTNRRAQGDFGRELDRLTWRILRSVKRWPTGRPL